MILSIILRQFKDILATLILSLSSIEPLSIFTVKISIYFKHFSHTSFEIFFRYSNPSDCFSAKILYNLRIIIVDVVWSSIIYEMTKSESKRSIKSRTKVEFIEAVCSRIESLIFCINFKRRRREYISLLVVFLSLLLLFLFEIDFVIFSIKLWI